MTIPKEGTRNRMLFVRHAVHILVASALVTVLEHDERESLIAGRPFAPGLSFTPYRGIAGISAKWNF